MLRTLIKSRIQALLFSMFRGRRGTGAKGGQGKGRTIGFAVLLIYCFGYFVTMFVTMYRAMCSPLKEAGLSWLYFAVAGLLAFTLGFITSVFMAKKQLFEARDNDLLLSLPIPPSYILISRMSLLYAQAFLFEAMVFIPAGVIYFAGGNGNAAGLFAFILFTILLPVFTMTFTSLFGWILASLSTRVRNKTVFSMVFSIAFLLVYFVAISRFNSFVASLVTNGSSIAASLRRAALPFYLIGDAIASGNAGSLAAALLIMILPFLLAYALLSKSFIKITSSPKSIVRVRYEKKRLKVSSIQRALVNKETRRFTSSSMYMMNAGLGLVFAVLAPIILMFRSSAIKETLAAYPGIPAGTFLIGGLCLLCSMTMISAPSISLEGKNLWILRSLPVDAVDILRAKAWCHIRICIPPTLFASLMLSILFRLSAADTFFLFLLPLLIVVFSGLLGVVINLRFPRFDWLSETVAVKQSMSVMVCMFTDMAVSVGPMILYGNIMSRQLSEGAFYLIFAACLILADLLLYHDLKTKGAAIFSRFDA